MEIKNLIKFAAQANTEEKARELLAMLEDAFPLEGPLKGLVKTNPDHGLEDDKAFVAFDLNHLINNQYAITIKPHIRDNELKVDALIVQFLDKQGFGSRRWTTVDELDLSMEPGSFETTEGWLAAIERNAIDLHANLMMSVGVPEGIAYSTANTCWQKG